MRAPAPFSWNQTYALQTVQASPVRASPIFLLPAATIWRSSCSRSLKANTRGLRPTRPSRANTPTGSLLRGCRRRAAGEAAWRYSRRHLTSPATPSTPSV